MKDDDDDDEEIMLFFMTLSDSETSYEAPAS